MILTPRRTPFVGGVALLLTLGLASCTAESPEGLSAPTPLTTPVILPASETAWEVSGGGEIVHGSAVLCPGETTILVEDAETLEGSDDLPVPSMSLIDGEVGYAASWSGTERPTGPVEGAGTYSLELDAEGAPRRITGSGTVVWYDADSDTTSERPDSFTFEFTAVPTPDYCG